MRIRLKKPTDKVNLGKVFNVAVEGYKNLYGEEEEGKVKLIPCAPYGYPVGVPMKPPEEPEEEKKEEPEEEVIIRRKREPDVDPTTVNLVYPLIPARSRNPIAYSHIKWSRAENAILYKVVEPELSQSEMELLNNIKASLIEKLDVDFTTLKKGEAKDFLSKRFEETVNLMAASLPPEKRRHILYFVERDFIGLGRVEPLMQDADIEDISCDGVGIPIYIYHRNPVIGSVKTNIMFENADELDTFVNKLAQRCGKTVSVARPLVNGSLPDGSRVQATLGTDIARKGSNFTIRKFTKDPLTPVHLEKFKTLDSDVAAYLWLAIDYGRSMLIAGGTATGKTSMLNALSLFIKPELKVVSIEDTPELRLPHPHWVPSVARQPIAEIEGSVLGEVDMFDLLRESLRQRPDYLIVGEVRGREAYVLFQQIATGHASLSTIHADSLSKLIDRLTTPPINLPANLIEALDVIIFLTKIKYGNTYVRKVTSILEILGFDREKNMPIVNEVFKWDPRSDKFEQVNPSVIVKKISEQYGINTSELEKELKNRKSVLDWMSERGIMDFMDVARIIKIYYSRPEDLLNAI